MRTEALFLFLILLLGLVLCSFLGGNCGREGFSGNFSGTFNIDNSMMSSSGASTASGNSYDNYNHYTGSYTQLTPGATYYGQNGTTAVVITNSDGSQSLQITLPGSSTPVIFSPNQQSTSPSTSTTTTSPSSSTTSTTVSTDASSSTVESYTNYYGYYGNATKYYGPNGATATVITANNGQQAIRVSTSTGVYYYNVSGSQDTTNTSTQYYGSTGYPIQQAPYSTSYYGPYGGSAGAATGPYGNTAYYAQGPGGTTVAGTTTTAQTTPYYSTNQYYGPYGGSAGSATGPYGNTAYYAQGPGGTTVAGTTTGSTPSTSTTSTSNTDYSSSLPPGIPASQIPPGQEDLYILKSEVVPPVCPACPTSASCPRQEQCPPCPACARCPEPSFECKKVPNYSAINNEYLPAPVLNDFSTFGM